MIYVVFKAFLIWMLIAGAEVLHGILLVRLLNRRVGDHRARQIAVFTGSGIILAIAWFTVPWVEPVTTAQQLGVGLLWLVLMLAFEIAFGRWVLRVSWQRIFEQKLFNPFKGSVYSRLRSIAWQEIHIF